MTGIGEQRLDVLLEGMPTISLEDMKAVKLMQRTDQKYVTTTAELLFLLELAAGSYYVQEINGLRIATYRTVYWDNPDGHTFFHDHQRGCLPRTKVRVRTYMDSNTSFLEVKRKDNHGKTHKSRIKISSLEEVVPDGEAEMFLASKTGFSFRQLQLSLGNQFQRFTLVNKAKTERVTCDFDLLFDNFETGRKSSLPGLAVIELKRDGRYPSPIHTVLRQLRIKPSGFSKYCMGMCHTADGLRINAFKERMRYVSQFVDNNLVEPLKSQPGGL